MTRANVFVFGICFALVAPEMVLAQDPAVKMPAGVWHYRSIACVDSTVTAVTPRLSNMGQKTFSAADFENSGVQVTFATHLGMTPAFPSAFAGVVHYQDTAGIGVMIAERPGDRVQVCFLGGPVPTQFCNPDTDSRGRSYRVYDYRQHNSYSGENGEHTCGGA